jgi:type I restriction enzyme S subunit
MNADDLRVLVDDLDEFVRIPGGIDRLRKVVLELAITGRLVAQEHDEGSGQELLRHLQSHGQKRANRRSPTACTGVESAEEPFSIPSSWVWTRFENLGDFGSGSTPDRSNPSYYDGSINWYKSGELTDSLLDVDSSEKITEAALRECPLRMNKPGDLLIAMYGATAGKLALLEREGTSNQAVCGITLHEGVVREYIYYCLLGTRSTLVAMSSGAAQPNISKVKIVSHLIPLPNTAEQRRIVAKVGHLFALIDDLETAYNEMETRRSLLTQVAFRRLAAEPTALDYIRELVLSKKDLGELEAAIRRLAVSGRLSTTEPGDEPVDELIERIRGETLDESQLIDGNGKPLDEPSPLPLGWRWVTLGSLLTRIQGGWSPNAQTRPKQGDEWGVLKVSACSWGEFKASENKALQPGQVPRPGLEIRPGDFLISRANTSALVARSVVVDETPAHLMLSDKTLRMTVANGCSARYLNLANLAEEARAHYKSEATGTSSSMKNVSQKAIRRAPIPLPPAGEQVRIAEAVDELIGLIRNLRLQLAA